MARKANRDRELFWRKLVERRVRSGRSVSDLCWEAGVSTASFFQWQRKLRERDAAIIATTKPASRVSAALVPVRIVDDQVPIKTAPLKTAVVADRRPAEAAVIELADGLRIRILSGCDAATIGHLLAAARGEL
ncbi:MAG: transposase [Pirellulales bacterium]